MKKSISIKRAISFLLILTILLTVLSACSKEQMESAGEVTDFSSEKHFGIEDIIQNGDESEDAPTTSETESSPLISNDESSMGYQSVDESKKDESIDTTSNTNGETSQSSENSKDSTSKPSDTSKDTTSKPAETSKDPAPNPPQGVTGEFVVSDKKYEYEGRNIMLLQVENKTNKDFDVTIKGKYLDKSGKVIKEESQTYRGFPSEWKNYFIFHPRMAFDKFEYTIEVKEFKVSNWIDELYVYNGKLLSKYAEFTYQKYLRWITGVGAKDLIFDYQLVNHHPNAPLTMQGHILVLDENGEIYGTDCDYADSVSPIPERCLAGTSADPIGGYFDGKAMIALRWIPIDGDATIPDSVQGKFTVIFAVRSITNDDVWNKWYREGKTEGLEIEGVTHN